MEDKELQSIVADQINNLTQTRQAVADKHGISMSTIIRVVKGDKVSRSLLEKLNRDLK